MKPTKFRVRRLFGWLPAAFFFALCVTVLAAASDLGTRLFYIPMTLLTGLWLVRSRRVSVQTTEDGLTVRGSLRTRRFARSDVTEAELVPMRTRSPFASRWPYVALSLRLRDGRTLRFEDVSAGASRASTISAIVDHINGWREGR